LKAADRMNADWPFQANVQDELKWRRAADAANLGVSMPHGAVTLTGQIAHYPEKAAAGQVMRNVYVVRELASDIAVKIPQPHERTDMQLAEAAASALKLESGVPTHKIRVLVRSGWTTLKGTVG